MTTKKPGRTVPDGTDNFDIELVSSFGGYVSSIDPTNADARLLVRGTQNMYKKISGTIANRPGRKLYDAVTDSTVAKCNAGFVWNTSLGTIYPIRVANGNLQVESAVTGTRVWYTLLSALAKTRFVFDTYWDNTDKKDKLLMANGTASTIYDWSGGFGLFVSAIANTSITLSSSAATSGFASMGTVSIAGVDYTYTGISGSSLTGVTGDASAVPANTVVMQKIKTVSSFSSGPSGTYAIDYLRVVANQAYYGSYTSQLLYISKNTDYTDCGHSTPRLTGEGDTVLLDAPGKGIGSRQGNAHAFYGTNGVSIITFNQITVGSTLSEQTLSQKVLLGNLMAAQGHEFIDILSDNLIYLDQANQVRSFGAFRNLFTAKPVLLSQAIQTELAEENFTLGQLKVVNDQRGDLVYINAPASGKTYLYQERSSLDSVGNVIAERMWQSPMTWNITRIDAIAGRTVGFSNSNPQIYYLWDTTQWHDDAPDGSLPYQSILLMSYQNGGRRQGKFNFDKIYWEGYATQNSNLYGGIYYNYEGAEALLSVILNDPTSPFPSRGVFTGVMPPSLGDASLGDNPLGDGTNTQPDDQAGVPKFKVITGVNQIDVFEWALMLYSTNIDARWELLALGVNATLAFAEAVEIVK